MIDDATELIVNRNDHWKEKIHFVGAGGREGNYNILKFERNSCYDI